MTNPDLTEIVCILDRSGSMAPLRVDAIEGIAARISIEAQATISFVASSAGVRQAYADMGDRVAEARRRPREGA